MMGAAVAWYQSPFILIMFVASATSVIIAYYAWSRQRVPEARPLALLLVASAEWTVTYGLEMASRDLATKVMLVKLQYFGIVSAPTMLLVFVLFYTGRSQWLTGRRLLLLWPEPLAVLLLSFTNEAHRFVWAKNTLDMSGSWPVMVNSYGPVGWANIAYAYAMIGCAALMLLQLVWRRRHRHGLRPVFVLLTGFTPWLASALYVTKHNPIDGLDLTPIGFTVMTLAFALGVSGLRLSDMLSVSRQAVIEHMRDGLVVLDTAGRIIDLNPAARRLAEDFTKPIGCEVSSVWPKWPNLRTADIDSCGSVSGEMGLSRGQDRVFEVQVSPVVDWRGLVVSRVAIIRDITERKRLEEELAQQLERAKYLADRDSVTGFLNHRAIHLRLEHEIKLSTRTGHPVSLVIMDMDTFKQFNDTYGHPVGDQVLIHAASILSSRARESDVLGRYGGDEFVAILPNTSSEGAVELASRLRTAMAERPYEAADGKSLAFRMSFGVAEYPADSGEVLGLMEVADAFLYESKRLGGNTITSHSSSHRHSLHSPPTSPVQSRSDEGTASSEPQAVP
jgi:diguanylate cyclase (GGDEF)-like protein